MMMMMMMLMMMMLMMMKEEDEDEDEDEDMLREKSNNPNLKGGEKRNKLGNVYPMFINITINSPFNRILFSFQSF